MIRAIADTFAEIEAMRSGAEVKGRHVKGFLEEFPLNEMDVVVVGGTEYYYIGGSYVSKTEYDAQHGQEEKE